jgi:hypothetical protein
MFLSVELNFRRPIYPGFYSFAKIFQTLSHNSLSIDLSRAIAASVCDHRLGYQHARRTHTIAAFNFLHNIFADDFQQAFFALGHSPWLDVEDAERANRKVITAERNAGVKAQAALF